MILSTYSPAELADILATENAVLLKNVKGLGLKTAQKIIVELKDKAAGLGSTGTGSPAQTIAARNGRNPRPSDSGSHDAGIRQGGFRKSRTIHPEGDPLRRGRGGHTPRTPEKR